MSLAVAALAGALAGAVAPTAGAASGRGAHPRPAPAGEQCPLAHERYSSRSPLLDLLLDARARAVLAREAPALLHVPYGPGGEWPAEPPSFAAILAPQAMLASAPKGAGTIARLDAALARVPVTHAAARARCARYDTAPPALPDVIVRPAVLVFAKINGFRDQPSVDAAREALRALGERRGWTMLFVDNGAVFNERDLARFDAVIWNNVSGDALTAPQRAAFRRWIERGGGYAGIHGSGGDPVYFWDWYADTLLGARFAGHPMDPQFQEARVVIEPGAGAIAEGLGDGWSMTEEWYSFAASARAAGAHVIARLDESTYRPVGMDGTDLRMGDHPIAWTRCIGDGRSFYTAIGHRPESYLEPHALRLLEQGIAWAAGLGASGCRAGTEQAGAPPAGGNVIGGRTALSALLARTPERRRSGNRFGRRT